MASIRQNCSLDVLRLCTPVFGATERQLYIRPPQHASVGRGAVEKQSFFSSLLVTGTHVYCREKVERNDMGNCLQSWHAHVATVTGHTPSLRAQAP